MEFWQAADLHERANGTTYREFEVALPRELAAADRLALVREFIAQELGERHAYQFAIHCPTQLNKNLSGFVYHLFLAIIKIHRHSPAERFNNSSCSHPVDDDVA